MDHRPQPRIAADPGTLHRPGGAAADEDRREYLDLLVSACSRNEDDLLDLHLAHHYCVDPHTQRSAHFDALVRAERVRREELAADERATALLLENLTEEQRRQYTAYRHFDVIGGESGGRYRISHRTAQNIEQLDAFGRRLCIWCVHPVGVATADVLLAQKTALELFEADAIRVANRHSDFASQCPDGATAGDRTEYMNLLVSACARNEDDLLELDLARRNCVDPYTQRSAHFDALVRAERARREGLANERAIALLLENLTEEQRQHLTAYRHFEVIGGESGKRYRIWHRTTPNIEELDALGHRICVWGVHPVGVPKAGVLLAQKMALELFETDPIRIARRSDFVSHSQQFAWRSPEDLTAEGLFLYGDELERSCRGG